MQTPWTLAEEAGRRQAVLESKLRGVAEKLSEAEDLTKASVSASGDGKTLAAFEPPVLEHLRQCNLAAYQKMMQDISRDIDAVLKRI